MVTDDCTQQFHVDVKQNWKSTDPWMTPKRRGQRSDLSVPINTNWNWPWRKEIKQTTWCPVIPSPKAVPEEYYGQWNQKPLRDQVEQGWIHYPVLFLPDNIRSVDQCHFHPISRIWVQIIHFFHDPLQLQHDHVLNNLKGLGHPPSPIPLVSAFALWKLFILRPS